MYWVNPIDQCELYNKNNIIMRSISLYKDTNPIANALFNVFFALTHRAAHSTCRRLGGFKLWQQMLGV